MMTESVDQSFQKLPRDPGGIFGGSSPLPHEKLLAADYEYVEAGGSDHGKLVSFDREDRVKIKKLLASNIDGNQTDVMEKK